MPPSNLQSDRAKEHVRELQRAPQPFRSARDRGAEKKLLLLSHPLPTHDTSDQGPGSGGCSETSDTSESSDTSGNILHSYYDSSITVSCVAGQLSRVCLCVLLLGAETRSTPVTAPSAIAHIALTAKRTPRRFTPSTSHTFL